MPVYNYTVCIISYMYQFCLFVCYHILYKSCVIINLFLLLLSMSMLIPCCSRVLSVSQLYGNNQDSSLSEVLCILILFICTYISLIYNDN